MGEHLREQFANRRQQIVEAGEGELRETLGIYRVICTDDGSHPSRECAELHLSYSPDDLAMFETLAFEAEDLETANNFLHLYDADRLGYGKSRRNRRGDSTHAQDVIKRRDLGDALWRFTCPTCRRDVPIKATKLAEVLHQFGAAGLRTLDISHL